jgi:serine/threonine-protein kinase
MPRRQSVSRRKAITVIGTKKETNVRTLVDRYRLDELVARTKSGEVYRGVDLHTCSTVAVKLMKSRFPMGENFGARMRREFEVLQRVAHPSVVRVLDCGEVSETEKFLVMEFAEGESLEALVQRSGPLPPAQICTLIYQIADALDAIHAYGFIHRDVNPSNIQVAVDRHGKWSAKLLDFGLVKIMDSEQKEQRLDLTGAVRIVGRAEYMPPEQFGNDPVTPATDIYSLGASAFFAASGSAPFQGENDVSIMMKQLRSSAPPTIASVNPDVKLPEAFESAIAKAMCFTPKNRFRTATEFATELCNVAEVSVAPIAPSVHRPPSSDFQWTGHQKSPRGSMVAWISVFSVTLACLVYLYLLLSS